MTLTEDVYVRRDERINYINGSNYMTTTMNIDPINVHRREYRIVLDLFFDTSDYKYIIQAAHNNVDSIIFL